METPNLNFVNKQNNLPNGQTVLILGIISIASCFLYGLPGLVCGIIAIVLSNRDLKLYNSNPNAYTANSFNNLKTGRTCAIIGVSLSAVFILFVIIYLAVFGAIFIKLFQEASHYH
jgi:hypothetical protein